MRMKYPGNPVPCAVYCEQQNCPTGRVLLLCPTSRTRLCCPLQTRLDRIMQVSKKTNKFDNLENTIDNSNKYISQFGQLLLAIWSFTNLSCPDRIVQVSNKRCLFVSLFSQTAFRHDMAAQWHEKYVEHMESVHNGQEHAG